MTLRRAALYIGGASLLVAWLASAASLSLSKQPRQMVHEPDPGKPQIEDLASTIQRQADRLRRRLAASPVLQQQARNPFAFRTVAARPSAQTPRALRPPSAPPVPAEPPEPALSMIGVAEQRRPQGLVRTAMLVTAGDELLMVGVGDTVLHRYTVTAINTDGVELSDSSTGRMRRLAMQFQP